MAHSREEVRGTLERYLAVRDGINAGNGTWADLAQFFTEDAVFVDPAWGRVEGIEEMKATVFGDAMVGLEDWKFPTEFYAIEGDNVVVKWKQVLPGQRADGRPYEQSGVSTLIYAGGGKFCNASGPLAVPTESVGWADTAPPTEADNRSLVLFDAGAPTGS